MLHHPKRKIFGYSQVVEIDKNALSTLFRGVNEHMDPPQPVLLKLINLDHLPAEVSSELKGELARLKCLDSDLILKVYDYQILNNNDGRQLLIASEDFEGLTIDHYTFVYNQSFFASGEQNTLFNTLAIQMAQAVRDIHKLGLIHKGLNPYHFLFTPDSNRVKLESFAWEHAWLPENQHLIDPNITIELLPYIAPEQSGRLIHPVDTRANLYSLGVIFYLMLTGIPLFPTKDSAKILYSHIAYEFVSPSRLNPNIPNVISKIVLKLLSKNPDDRYQSISGLIHDLKKIGAKLRQKVDIETFQPGQNDVSPIFKIPSILYGRKKQISLLQNCFDRVRAGDCHVVLIAGEPGIGKTELAQTFSNYVHAAGGIFITEKYDRNSRNTPGSILKTLMSSLAKWLLTQTPDQIEVWRQKIQSAASPNGQVIVDLVPEMELIIGPQTPVCELPPEEARTRANLVLEKVASLFPAKDRPVTLFIDDLHWADLENLETGLTFMLARHRQYLLVLGTYRSNEVDQTSPLAKLLPRLSQSNIPYKIINLYPFDPELTNRKVGGILNQRTSKTMSLAKVVHSKTAGNPFFIGQFMNALYSNGLIHYDMDCGAWVYDVRQVATLKITDNVATLLFEKIYRLSSETLDVLQAAACGGFRLDIALLAATLHQDQDTIRSQVQKALKAGLLRFAYEGPSRDHYLDFEDQNEPEKRPDSIEFAHDQILQAVYQSIPEPRQQSLHWELGKAMVKIYSPERIRKEIFQVVDHFKQALSLVVSPQEKKELARLSLMAGQYAMESASFDAAHSYLRLAVDLLPVNSWQSQYELTSTLYSRLARCEFVLGRIDVAIRLFDTLIQRAASVLDKIKIYNVLVGLYTGAGDIDKALHYGRCGLALVDIHMPVAPKNHHMFYLLIKLRLVWGFRKLSSLVEAAELKDELIIATLGLMTSIGQPAYKANSTLCLWNIATAALLGIREPKKGYPLEHASFGLISLGAFIGFKFGSFRMGKMYADIGMRLLQRHPHGPYQAMAYFVSAFFNRHWYEPASKTIDHFKHAYRHALNMGNIAFAGFSISFVFTTRLFVGDNLDDAHTYHKRHAAMIHSTRSSTVISLHRSMTQFYLSLKGQTKSPTSMDNDDYDIEKEIREHKTARNGLLCFVFLLLRLKLYVFYQEWENAYEIVMRMRPICRIPAGTLIQTEYYFYAFLTATGLLQHPLSRDDNRWCKKMIKLCMKKMKRWSRVQSDNFKLMLAFMQAEREKLFGNPIKAAMAYRKTIKMAKAEGITHITAMACEHVGQELLKLDDSTMSQFYMSESKRYYSIWGATAKAESMQKRYSDLFVSGNGDLTSSAFSYFEVKPIVEALQTISKEMVARKVLSKLMRIILESSGANRVVFITDKNSDLFVEMDSRNRNADQTGLKTEPLLIHKDTLMSSVIYYVKRTHDFVVMNDVKKNSDFMQKEYNDPSAPKSLVCLPLIRKKKFVGILYLENTLTAGVFTPHRIEIIKMVASQAAISFENATLYEHVMENEHHLKVLSQKLRGLYSELMLTEERERRRIATELHDRIGHALASAKMSLKEIHNDQACGQQSNRISGVIAMIEESIADTRTLTFELSPPILYHLGLGAAVDWLCEETQKKHGLKVFFDEQTPDANIDQKTSVFCFQVLRELMFNVIKHAKAENIRISLAKEQDRIQMTIQDDGIGFDPTPRESIKNNNGDGFGLFSIHERLSLVDGRMRIHSKPNQGTVINITILCGLTVAAQEGVQPQIGTLDDKKDSL